MDTGQIDIDLVEIVEPVLWKVCFYEYENERESGAIAFRVQVPQQYLLSPGAPITLRLSLLKCGETDCSASLPYYGSPNPDPDLVLSLIAKRAVPGGPILDYGSQIWVMVSGAAASPDDMVQIDIPLFAACPGGLGGPAVDAGDFLAFELNAVCADATYFILQAELFAWETAAVSGATILCDPPSCPCEQLLG